MAILRYILTTIIFMSASLIAVAQNVTGRVTDAKTHEPLPYANVFYQGGRGVQTDLDGKFSLPFKAARLYFSLIGYDTKSMRISKPGTSVDIQLVPNSQMLDEAVVEGTHKKYRRKDNPAVAMMRKVIAAKKKSNLKQHDYYSFDKYSKLTFAFNEVNDSAFSKGVFKNMQFLRDHVETCNETGKLILPISVDETVTRQIYRKKPEADKQIILGQRSTGINDLFNTGDILTTLLKDCFTDVDIYEERIRLLQAEFTSPIATHGAIMFYRYFIEDTLMVDSQKCFHLSFTPNNSQDFGFSGDLYVLADSSYRVLKIDMGLPMRSNVNWVERLRIIQQFEQLPTGEQVMQSDNMLVQLKIAKHIQKFQVKRTTEYSDYSFDEIPAKTFKFKGNQLTATDAQMRGKDFWEKHRSEVLTKSEGSMERLIRQLEKVKGFKAVLWIAKAFIENFVETSVNPDHPSKVDIGPVNTMISQNFVDGLRLRATAQTTANLNPHLFLKGYVAYGFKDQRWKGMGEVTYSFNKKAYLPREFPVNNLTFTYGNDVMSPSDKFMPTDKDNVFTSLKWTTVDHMMYYRNYRLSYDREWENGLRFKVSLRNEVNEPTAALFYRPLSTGDINTQMPSAHIKDITTTDATINLTFQPGVTWINTKQRRIPANNDAPIFSLSHTLGLKDVLGGDFGYNFTEASIYKRFWLASWGHIDAMAKGGVQWNQVPYPLLIMPAANLSYIMEDNTFNLIDNMEFLNDRYASLMVSWDLNGKILNRIPLIRKLKWREYLGCNVLWGTLSDQNNPFLPANAGSPNLFYFPGRYADNGTFDYLSSVMDKKRPYVEVVAGIHNIFKVFHIEYVRRLNYLSNPDTHKWGIRCMFRVTF